MSIAWAKLAKRIAPPLTKALADWWIRRRKRRSHEQVMADAQHDDMVMAEGNELNDTLTR